MGIFEILEETGNRGLDGAKNGGCTLPGVLPGIVAENYSEKTPGKVRVKIPVRDEGADVLKWAKVGMPYGGRAWGFYFLPEKDDQVLLAFEQGNIEKPYVIACIPREGDPFAAETADEDNQRKRIVTKNGNSLTFTDHREGAEKDRVVLASSQDVCSVCLDNEKKKIVIADKENSVGVELDFQTGQVQIHGAKKLTIQAGDGAGVSIDAEAGTIKMEAEKIQISGKQSVELSGKSTVKISGQQISGQAASTLTLSSNGTASLKGTPVRLG